MANRSKVAINGEHHVPVRAQRVQSVRNLVNGGLIDLAVSIVARPEDAIVVNGFWRSGTTYLLELLAEAKWKPVFEPFHFSQQRYHEVVEATLGRAQPDDFVNYYMPYCRHSLRENPVLHEYLDAALRGRLTTSCVQRSRRSMTAAATRGQGRVHRVLANNRVALRRNAVVKFVRGHLLLPALKRTYGPWIVHIRRDPRAIAASFKRDTWRMDGSTLSLEQQLLGHRDGREEFFGPYRTSIAQADRASRLGKLVFYWAMLEKFVDAHAMCCTIVSYEDVARSGLAAIPGASELLPSMDAVPRPQRDSATTSKGREGASIEQRTSAWQKELTQGEIDEIHEALRLADYADWTARIQTAVLR